MTRDSDFNALGLQRNSLSEQAYTSLRSAIVTSQLKPGQRLVERRIGEILGVSRTPLREAMIRLAHEGVLEILSSGGMIVAPVDEADAREWYAIRKALEGYAARLATESADEAFLGELRTIALRQEEHFDPVDLQQLDELNNQFHRLLYAGAHMPRLEELIDSYRQRQLHYFVYGDYTLDEVRRGIDEHGQIVEAMAHGHADSVEKLLRQHIAQGERIVLERRITRRRRKHS